MTPDAAVVAANAVASSSSTYPADPAALVAAATGVDVATALVDQGAVTALVACVSDPSTTTTTALRTLRNACACGDEAVAAALAGAGAAKAAAGVLQADNADAASPLAAAQLLANLALACDAGATAVWMDAVVTGALTRAAAVRPPRGAGAAARAARAAALATPAASTDTLLTTGLIPAILHGLALDAVGAHEDDGAATAAADAAALLGWACLERGRLADVVRCLNDNGRSAEHAVRLLGHWVADGVALSEGAAAHFSDLAAAVTPLIAPPQHDAGLLEASLHLARELAARDDVGRGVGDALVVSGAVGALLSRLDSLPPLRGGGGARDGGGDDNTSSSTHRFPLYPAERADAVAALAALLASRPAAAAALLAYPHGPALLLAQCVADPGSSFVREWGLYAIRNATAVSDGVRAALAALTPVRGVDTPELAAAGLRVELDEAKGTVTVVKTPTPPLAPARGGEEKEEGG